MQSITGVRNQIKITQWSIFEEVSNNSVPTRNLTKEWFVNNTSKWEVARERAQLEYAV